MHQFHTWRFVELNFCIQSAENSFRMKGKTHCTKELRREAKNAKCDGKKHKWKFHFFRLMRNISHAARSRAQSTLRSLCSICITSTNFSVIFISTQISPHACNNSFFSQHMIRRQHTNTRLFVVTSVSSFSLLTSKRSIFFQRSVFMRREKHCWNRAFAPGIHVDHSQLENESWEERKENFIFRINQRIRCSVTFASHWTTILLTCYVDGRSGEQQKYQKASNQSAATLLSIAQFSSRESNIWIGW